MIHAIGTPNSEAILGSEGNDFINGMAGDDVLYGLGGNDQLFGELGNDYLDGGFGDDYMSGGLGNDSYSVDSLHDEVIERVGEGIDQIDAQISFSLEDAPEVENLVLRGFYDLNGEGNRLDNYMVGNEGDNEIKGGLGNDQLIGGGGADTLIGGDGADTLTGGLGSDTLRGGAGGDRFLFLGPDEGADRITDFSRQQGDKILLSSETFAVRMFTPRQADLSLPIQLDSRLFVLGNSAQDRNDRLIYNQQNGKLFYDPDGTGSRAKVHLATLTGSPSLAASDFGVIVV